MTSGPAKRIGEKGDFGCFNGEYQSNASIDATG